MRGNLGAFDGESICNISITRSKKYGTKKDKDIDFYRRHNINVQKGLGYSREDIIKQVVNKETHVKNYREYVPVLGAVSKIWKWSLQDAEIIYLTSRKKRRRD